MTDATNLHPEAVFFDMDGLLIDTEPYWLATERELMSEFDVNWRIEDQMYCLGGPMTKVGAYMHELAQQRKSPEWFIEELISRMSVKFQEIALMPGMGSLLNEVANLRVPSALVSASPRRLVDSALKAIADHPFLVTISSDDVIHGKPHPEPYLRAAEQLGVDITNSLIFEDSPTGVSAARASGAWVIAIPHIAPIEPANKSLVIATADNESVVSLWNRIQLN